MKHFDVPQPGHRHSRILERCDHTAGTSRPIVPSFNADQGQKPVSQESGMLINFEFDSIVTAAESLPYVDSVGEILNMEDPKDPSITVECNTDAIGVEAYNRFLPERRALAVKSYPTGVHNISTRIDWLLRVKGKGRCMIMPTPRRLSTDVFGSARSIRPRPPRHPIHRCVNHNES